MSVRDVEDAEEEMNVVWGDGMSSTNTTSTPSILHSPLTRTTPSPHSPLPSSSPPSSSLTATHTLCVALLSVVIVLLCSA